jgi:hypothetical protein
MQVRYQLLIDPVPRLLKAFSQGIREVRWQALIFFNKLQQFLPNSNARSGKNCRAADGPTTRPLGQKGKNQIETQS